MAVTSNATFRATAQIPPDALQSVRSWLAEMTTAFAFRSHGIGTWTVECKVTLSVPLLIVTWTGWSIAANFLVKDLVLNVCPSPSCHENVCPVPQEKS